jgi:Helix-turn-helix domain
METEKIKRLLTPDEVSIMLGKTPAWVKAHANGNRKPILPSMKIGKSRMFRREAIEEFMIDLEHETRVQIERKCRRHSA